MLSPRWRKVLHDLWRNRTRSLLVVLSIAVGVFAVGTIASIRVILERDLARAHLATNPMSASVWAQPFDQDLVNSIRQMQEVRDADGRRYLAVRVQAESDRWKDLQLIAIPKWDDMRVNKIFPASGTWPPGRGEVLIERASLPILGKLVDEQIVVEMPDGKQIQLQVVGTVHDVNRPPVKFSSMVYGYINMDTLEGLGESRDITFLYVVVAEREWDTRHIRQVVERVQDKIRAGGWEPFGSWIPTPDRHPAEDVVRPILLVLGVLGMFALFLSGFLVVNTMTAVMAEQVRQMGIMKAIGASRGQLIRMYLVVAGAYGVLALAIGVPLGVLAARTVIMWLAALLNFDVTSYAIPWQVLTTQVTVGLLVPTGAALLPVALGTRVTVLEAITNHGMLAPGYRYRLGWGPKRVSLRRPLLLALHNVFRRPDRLTLTVLALAMAGAVFIGVVSVRDSMLLTLDRTLQHLNYDFYIHFDQPYSVETVEEGARQIPGVSVAEGWGSNRASRVHPDGTITIQYRLLAPPPATDFIRPALVAGRWLLPEDENAVVVNSQVIKDEPDIKVDDEIVLRIAGNETNWKVVGIIRHALPEGILYANYSHLGQVTDRIGQVGRVMIRLEQSDPASYDLMATILRQHLEAQGMKVAFTRTVAEDRNQVVEQFDIVVIFLLIMSLLLALVGGLGLMGTMTINVLERSREIGIMRAIGASTRTVMQIVLIEGLGIGLISWFFGSMAALPISRLLSNSVGLAFLKAPLDYTFSLVGAVIWLGVVLAVSCGASFLPAWRAVRLSVRQVLTYA